MELLWQESSNDTIMSPGKGRGRDITCNSEPVFNSKKWLEALGSSETTTKSIYSRAYIKLISHN